MGGPCTIKMSAFTHQSSLSGESLSRCPPPTHNGPICSPAAPPPFTSERRWSWASCQGDWCSGRVLYNRIGVHARAAQLSVVFFLGGAATCCPPAWSPSVSLRVPGAQEASLGTVPPMRAVRNVGHHAAGWHAVRNLGNTRDSSAYEGGCSVSAE